MQQFGGDVESVRRMPSIDEKALHTAIITHLYRNGSFRSAAKFAEVRESHGRWRIVGTCCIWCRARGNRRGRTCHVADTKIGEHRTACRQ